MADGMAIAAVGMNNDMQRLNSISGNMANALTPGYKRTLSFVSAMKDRSLVMGNGLQQVPVPALATVTDMKPAVLRGTGNPLDLAIEGQGFFEVQQGGQTFYTRQGNFTLDANAQLRTLSGDLVMGLGGVLQLSTGQPTIERDGRIVENAKPVGQLKLVSFDDPRLLQPVGDGKFLQGAAVVKNDGVAIVRQGQLEASNVNSAQDMVKLIETMRHFESGQKVIQMYDDMAERVNTKLGDF